MREILFRSKDIHTENWVYGFYFYSCEPDDNGLPENYYKETFTKLYYIMDKNGNSHLVYPYSFGQYTGIKDKFGNKIFEGDILDIHKTVNGCNLFVVIWDEIGFSVKYYCNMNKPRVYEYDLRELFDLDINESKFKYEKEIEIVGNIHDNPDLLKEVNNE